MTSITSVARDIVRDQAHKNKGATGIVCGQCGEFARDFQDAQAIQELGICECCEKQLGDIMMGY